MKAWVLLFLIGLTATLVVAMPTMAIPVLLPEITDDLGLNLVQVGMVWGIGSLAGMVTGLGVGMFGDRFGPRRILIVSCLFLGFTGALRGLANNYAVLAVTNLLSGFLVSVIPQTLHNGCGVWFSGKRLGLANGFVSAGMAAGFMMGSLISATFLSPWLGGWRQVMFFYGAIAGIMALPWIFVRINQDDRVGDENILQPISIKASLLSIIKIQDVWLLGLVLLGVSGCVQGILGYLPTYLREIGWTPSRADFALGSFHAISLAAVFPITVLSDRLGTRKKILATASLMITIGATLLGMLQGEWLSPAILVTGVVRDGFMALLITMVTESNGVNARNAGAVIGFSLTLGRLGEWLAPPIGNSLAGWDLRFPFLFWALMACAGLGILIFVKRE